MDKPTIDVISALIGCAWGRSIGAHGYDVSPCPGKATDVIVLHNPHSDPGFPNIVELRLCAIHGKFVRQHTDSHAP